MRRHLAALACVLALAGCGKGNQQASQSAAPPPSASAAGPAAVNEARVLAADKEPGNWLVTGGNYDDTHFSLLKKVNADNAKQLGLAWFIDLDSHRGQEATPIVIDGVMYFSTAWSRVKAVNAKTGAVVWEYDPKVPGAWAVNVCCDVVNRGVAAWNGKIYVGTLDGRLIALDAKTGSPVWTEQTFDKAHPYSITGAPTIIKGLVLIGNGGSEFDARGYVTAYDAESGKQVWRFYTVPGDPSKGFENKAMEMAAKTWNGQWWKLGGGGSPWNTIHYDPSTDLVYIGTGNGTPWNRAERSPQGGDNLFLASIVAIKPETGEYVWHYQTVPGDDWDFDSTQGIISADLQINGAARHVIMQAPKNGFFYVLDAKTGELISAKDYAPTNWATGIDMKTGRPIENPAARNVEKGGEFLGKLGPNGGHTWQAWSFSPITGLVYIPEQQGDFPYKGDKDFEPTTKGVNLGLDPLGADAPVDAAGVKAATASWEGSLLAWDPVKQAPRWRALHDGPWNGGILSTAGNIVVQGVSSGNVEAYRADTGEKLWSFFAQTGVMGGPMSYEVDGEQYIAVLAGWGGAHPLVGGAMTKSHNAAWHNISRLLVFKLGGTASLPPVPEFPQPKLDPPPMPTDTASIEHGKRLFGIHCYACHGSSATSGGLVPDLRYSGRLKDDAWYTIVLEGELEDQGMVNFSSVLSRQDATDIRNYVIKRAHDTLDAEKAAASPN